MTTSNAHPGPSSWLTGPALRWARALFVSARRQVARMIPERLKAGAFTAAYDAFSLLFPERFEQTMKRVVDSYVKNAITAGVNRGVAERLAAEGIMACAICGNRWNIKKVGDRYGCGTNTHDSNAHWKLLEAEDAADAKLKDALSERAPVREPELKVVG